MPLSGIHYSNGYSFRLGQDGRDADRVVAGFGLEGDLRVRFLRSVLHGDFDFRNVFIDPATESITALIDFGDVKCGNPDWEFGVMFAHETRGFPEVLQGYDPTGETGARLRTKLPAYGMARAIAVIRWLHEHGQPFDYWVGVLEGWSRKLAPVP